MRSSARMAEMDRGGLQEQLNAVTTPRLLAASCVISIIKSQGEPYF
jgi:hypothetical protein